MTKLFSSLTILLLAFTVSAQSDTSKTVLDSIHRQAFLEWKQNNEAKQKTNEAIAADKLNAAVADINNTRVLVFDEYPKAQFSDDLTRLKNLEEFSCLKCKQLNLDILFDQLAKLPKLKKLDLTGGVYTQLSNNIKQLTALEELKLKDNNIKALPDSIIKLQKLRVLNLEHTAYLYDEDVYAKLAKMNVEELNFAASGLFEISNNIGNAKSLKKLDYSVNDIKILPASFTQLSKLQSLNLSKNLNLDLNALTLALATGNTIQELNLSECNIVALPLDLGKLTNLKWLDVKGNRLTALPLTFSNLVNLEYLDLSYFEMGIRMNKITDLGPGFVNLKKLKVLNLAGNQLAALPEGFGNLTDLVELNLSLNKLPGFPQPLTNLTKLKLLDLGLNDAVSLPENIGNLSNLEVLILDGNFFNKLDKKIKNLPASICNLSNLKVLSLKDNVIEVLPDCIHQLSKLEKLDLRDNLIDSLPKSFTQLKNLQWLDLKANDVTYLPADFYNLTALKEFNFSMNIKINFEVEKAKFAKMQGLELLDLSYNNLTRDQVNPLRTQMPNTKILNYDYRKY